MRAGSTSSISYDALGRRVLVRTRQEFACGLNCRNAIVRTVWDGDQVLYEISSQGATSASTAEVERDVDHVVDQTQSLYFPYGRIVYTHGQSVDRPLAFARISYSNVFPDPILILPQANWQGHYDLGYYWASPIMCRRYPDPINGTSYCMQIDWPAPYMWKTMYERSRGSGPVSWMGSLIEEGRDASGQMYRRNRYYDPVTGRFTQEDPMGLAGGLNAYGFAGGDPVNFGDPSGLCPDNLKDKPDDCVAWDKQEAAKADRAPPCPETSLLSVHGAGVQLEASGAVSVPGAPGFGLAGTGTVGGGAFWGGPEGVTTDDFVTGGLFAGGPFTARKDEPAGFVVGKSAGAGSGLYLTNAKVAGQLEGPFTTLQASLGRYGVSVSWSQGIWTASVTQSLISAPTKSFALYTTYTRTTGKACRQ